MKTQSILMGLTITTAIATWAGRTMGDEPNNPLAFKPAANGGYTFDTGVLKGMLRENGTSRALTSVVHIPSGMRLDGSVGIAGHYRVFTKNKRYGTAAWDWPGTAELLPDGGVRTMWPAAEGRPFEMTARYRWADQQTLDVETTIKARETLTGFESFFASYFNETFPSPYVLADTEGPKILWYFLRGEKNLGDWLMFTSKGDPRTNVIQDGRWLLEPNPVKWAVLPRLDAPLCLRRGQGHKLAVVVMAPRQDCFTVAMPHEGESHYSLYLSLFGRDIKAGESAKAHSRFVVVENVSDGGIDRLYGQYLTQLSEQ
jgi:hypothetical protein